MKSENYISKMDSTFFLTKGRLKKNVKFGLLAEPPLTPPPNLGPVIRSIFLLFYSNLHNSKHETALWSTFSPSDIHGRLRTKLSNSLKNLEELLWSLGVLGGGGL